MLAPFAVGQIAILRAISALGEADLLDLVQRTGKKLGLVQRDVRKLAALGLVSEDPIKLTDAGCEEINRLGAPDGEVSEAGAPVPTYAPDQIALLRGIARLGETSATALAEHLSLQRDSVISPAYALEKAGLLDCRIANPVGATGYCEPWYSLTATGAAEVARIGEANPVRETAADGYAEIPHVAIFPDPLNPRREFAEEELGELADSIFEGGKLVLLQPLVVRPGETGGDWRVMSGETEIPRHRLVAGERRWRAIGLLIKRGDWPADKPVPVVIRAMNDVEHSVMALAENLQRKDLSPLEEAEAFQRLVNQHGWSTAEVALKIGKTQRFVQLRLKLLELTDDQKAKLSAGELSVKDAGKILANRPELVPMTADQLLVAAEVFVLTHPEVDRWTTYWKTTECRHDTASHPIVAEMIEARLIKVEGPDHFTGRFEISAGHHGMLALEQNAASLTAAKTLGERVMALEELRTKATGVTIQDLAPYLVGPFELTAEGQAKLDEAVARQEVRNAEEAERMRANGERIKRERATAERSKALVNDFAARQWPADGVQELLADTGAPLPWRFVESDQHGDPGRILDANGKTVDLGSSGWRGPESGALLRLVMASINAAADLDPIIERPEPEGDAEGEPGEWEPETEEEFLSIVTQQFQAHGATETLAVELTKQAYARATEDGETHGDSSCEWSRLDAKVIADGYVEDFPDCLVTPPVAEAAA